MTATDQGVTVQHATSKQIRVLIQRVNEYAPIFTTEGSSLSILEDTSVNSLVHNVCIRNHNKH